MGTRHFPAIELIRVTASSEGMDIGEAWVTGSDRFWSLFIASPLLIPTPSHIHTHTHTYTHRPPHRPPDVSTVIPVIQDPYVPTTDSLMLRPQRNSSVWRWEESPSIPRSRKGTRREELPSTACPRQKGIPLIVSGRPWSRTVQI